MKESDQRNIWIKILELSLKEAFALNFFLNWKI